MIVKIQPSAAGGLVQAPASKSSMQRACAAALLSRGTTRLLNPGTSNDDLAALDVIQKLGAVVNRQADGTLIIVSQGVRPVSSELNCGESGLGIRMFTPIAALSNQEILIKGSGSLASRPMDFFDAIFPSLGVSIASRDGKIPLRIQGPLRPADIEIDGSLSSQFLTGLLMAYGAAGARDICIKVNGLASKPYIDLTLRVMEHFGVKVENNDYETFCFRAAPAKADTLEPVHLAPEGDIAADLPVPGDHPYGYKAASYEVEGDWSGAAFLLVAGAVAGQVTVNGLDTASTQADKAILAALKDCGAGLSFNQGRITVSSRPLKAFRFDATECPDLFPPLVALAAYCTGETILTGTGRLTHKESNRAVTLQEEFGKMGVKVVLQDDRMIIYGSPAVKGAVVHSRHDHRIAMACAVAALGATGETTIEEAEAIDKSYPAFYDHLRLLGVIIPKFEI